MKISLPLQMSQFELDTRNLFNKVDWSPETQVVARTFSAMAHASLSAKRVAQIAAALAGYPIDEVSLQPILSSLVRQKVLRSRRARGETLYEANY
jgi:hypothetical protein